MPDIKIEEVRELKDYFAGLVLTESIQLNKAMFIPNVREIIEHYPGTFLIIPYIDRLKELNIKLQD